MNRKTHSILLFFIFLCLCCAKISIPKDPLNNATQQNSILQKSTQYIRDHALTYIGIGLLAYLNKQILHDLKNNPYITALIAYFVILYSCDVFLKVKEEKLLVNMLHAIQKSAFYLVCCNGIRNFLLEHPEHGIDADTFLDEVMSKNPYDFLHAMQFVIKSYKDLESAIENFNFAIPTSSEEYAYLSYGKNISTYDLLKLAKKDPTLHGYLIHVIKNEPNYNVQVVKHLQNKLQESLQELEETIETALSVQSIDYNALLQRKKSS